MHSLGGGVAGQGGRVVVGQLLKVVGFIIGCSDNRVISSYSFWHHHGCSGDQYKPFEPKKNPLV